MRCMLACSLLVLVVGLVPQGDALGGDMPAALATGYGNGVHAFYEGDYQCSYDELSRVIEAGSNDPRVFYYRGLAALKLGRTDEADLDFQQGANLEADGVGGRAVSRALERIQGCDRLKLEQFRAQARVSAIQRDRESIRQRYSDIYEAEPEVLRRRRPEPAEPVEAPAPRAKQPRAADAEEPMEERTEEPTDEPAEKPAEEPADAPA
jgi:Flp pilus assembly protein TadD